MVGCVACMSLLGLHLCVTKVRQGALTCSRTSLVYEDCGVLKVLEYVSIFVLLCLVWRNLFTNERLQSQVRWSLLRMCCSSIYLTMFPVGVVHMHENCLRMAIAPHLSLYCVEGHTILGHQLLYNPCCLAHVSIT